MKKALCAAVAAAAVLSVWGAGAAWAGTSNTQFSVTMPSFQQAYNAPATYKQTKSTTNADGAIAFTSVGSNYKASARMCNDSYGTCAVETRALDDGEFDYLVNGFNKGQTVGFQLHEQPWAAVEVDAVGRWHSN